MNISKDISTNQPRTSEVFDVFGVRMEFLVSPEETGNQISVYRGTVDPALVIPLHSHPDPEVFYITEGTLDIYQEVGDRKGWTSVPAGTTVAIAPHVKHALRNLSRLPASTVAVTQSDLYSLFRSIAKPLSAGLAGQPPTPEDMQNLFMVAAKYSYWMGSPEENAAIGLHLPSFA